MCFYPSIALDTIEWGYFEKGAILKGIWKRTFCHKSPFYDTFNITPIFKVASFNSNLLRRWSSKYLPCVKIFWKLYIHLVSVNLSSQDKSNKSKHIANSTISSHKRYIFSRPTTIYFYYDYTYWRKNKRNYVHKCYKKYRYLLRFNFYFCMQENCENASLFILKREIFKITKNYTSTLHTPKFFWKRHKWKVLLYIWK